MIDRKLADKLREKAKKGDRTVLRSAELKALFDELKTLPASKKGAYGKEVNALRQELTELIEKSRDEEQAREP